MHLTDLDQNGSIEKEELEHNAEVKQILQDYFTKAEKNALARVDIVNLIPELADLENLVNKLEKNLSYASYDPLLRNIKKIACVIICQFCFFLFLIFFFSKYSWHPSVFGVCKGGARQFVHPYADLGRKQG